MKRYLVTGEINLEVAIPQAMINGTPECLDITKLLDAEALLLPAFAIVGAGDEVDGNLIDVDVHTRKHTSVGSTDQIQDWLP